jgi:transcriptional regulator with XRE-family HTH domain
VSDDVLGRSGGQDLPVPALGVVTRRSAGESAVTANAHDRQMETRSERRRSSRARRLGRVRADYLARRLATAIHERRRGLLLTQLHLADLVGVSQREISRLELGHGATATIETWAACGIPPGLQLAAFFEQAPGADQPRDLEHLRRQNLVIETAATGGWVGQPEAALLGDGPHPRSIDVLLTRAARREAAVVEIWDLLLDGGAAMRGLEAKVLMTRQHLGPGWHVEGLLVVRGTQRNRRLIAGLRGLFAARYPASSHAWIRALRAPDVPLPQGAGLVWTDVKGDRLHGARLS